MKTKLLTPDDRMLRLMAWAIEHGKAVTESEYLDKIEFSRQNISNIRRGHQSFTREQVINACRITGASANWVLGLSSEMMRKPGKTGLEQLKEAVIAVEAEQSLKPLLKENTQYNGQ